MGNTTQPEMPKLYRIAIFRPSSDPKTPDLKVLVSEKLFLFTDDNEEVSSDAAAKRKIEMLRDRLLKGWILKYEEVPFTVTRGAPALIATCPRATCVNFGKQTGPFRCGACGETLSPEMIASTK
jgi:hypothetical protein